MNLITPGVMGAMAGASSGARLADTSMGAYRQAKARGDVSGMARAAGYAADSMTDAAEAVEEARSALQRARAEVRAEEKKRLSQESQARRLDPAPENPEEAEAQASGEGAKAAAQAPSVDALGETVEAASTDAMPREPAAPARRLHITA